MNVEFLEKITFHLKKKLLFLINDNYVYEQQLPFHLLESEDNFFGSIHTFS